MPKIDDYYTVRECAQELNCDNSTVSRWVKRKLIPSEVKFGLTVILKKHCKRPDGLDPKGRKPGYGKGAQ